MNKIVYDLILKLEQCDDKHNRCDYLLEHDEITYLLEFIKPLYEKDKEIERLNNIINELRRMMFCNKMYCEKLFEESKLSQEDFKQQHPYTLGSYDNSVNLLERLEELKEGK